MAQLSKRQSEILNFLKEFATDNDYAPSYREIGEALGISSPATIHQHIQTLNKGISFPVYALFKKTCLFFVILYSYRHVFGRKESERQNKSG